jgi:hypothetical protein
MKYFKLLFMFIVFSVVLTTTVFAQWGPDQRLTNTSSSSFLNNNNAWNIAASGDTVHVIYADDQNGAFQVYYTSSYDAGINWNTPVILSQDISNIWNYAITVSGSTVHVVWINNMANRFLYRRSTNAGAIWSQEDTILTTTQNFDMHCIAANGNNVYLVWSDNRHPINNNEIYFISSNDAGLNWGTPQRLTNTGNAIGDGVPSIAVNGNILHLVWGRASGYYYRRILYLRSTNYGITWEPERFLTSDTIDQRQPVVAVAGSNVHVTWMDQRNNQIQIYYRMSSDNGANWQQETYLTGISYTADYQTICAIGNNVHVAWRDFRTIPWHIGYRNSINNGMTWQSDTILTFNSYTQEGPSIAAAGSKVHLIWYDNRAGNWEIYYKQNPTGSGVIEQEDKPLSSTSSLLNIYPNPAKSQIAIRYSLPAEIKATIQLFDISGRLVKTLINEEKKPGTYRLTLNTNTLSAGIYFLSLETEEKRIIERLVIIK